MSACESGGVTPRIGDGRGSDAVGLVGIELDGRLMQLSNQHIQQLRAGVRRLGYHRCGLRGAQTAAALDSAQERNSSSAVVDGGRGGREARREPGRGASRESDRRMDRGSASDRGEES